MANKIGGIVTHFARSERSLIVAIMVIVGLMSGVLSNTGTAAVLIPVVIGIAAKSGYARSKPVSYTHLDVYKRQGWERVTAAKVEADGFVELTDEEAQQMGFPF